MPRCSAVLIGERYGLTNDHCRVSRGARRLRSGVRLRGRSARQSQVVHAFRSRTSCSKTTGRADLDSCCSCSARTTQARHRANDPEPQCLSRARVERDDPLYVVCYPLGEPRTVHDNAFVYFPFVVTPEERARLEIQVRDESIRSTRKTSPFARPSSRNSPTATFDHAQWRAGLQIFQHAIRQPADDGRRQRHLPRQFGLAGLQPTYYTFIGLLFDGQEDMSQPWVRLACARSGVADHRSDSTARYREIRLEG